MAMDTALDVLRQKLARHDASLTALLCERARLGWVSLSAGCPARTHTLQAEGERLPPGSEVLSGFVPRMERDYLERVLPMIAQPGVPVPDSAALRRSDEACVRALLQRLAFAVQVADLKITGGGARLRRSAAAGDAAALHALITYPGVEQHVIARARGCAAEFAAGNRHPEEETARLAAALEAVFRDWLIPLSRDVQVAWLMARFRRPRGG